MSDRAYTWCFFLLVIAILLFSDKGKIAGDGIKRWNAMTSLAEQGQLTDGRYSMVQPLFAMPLYGIGAVYSKVTGADNHLRTKNIHAFVQRFNKIVVLGLAAWFYFFLRRNASWSARPASLAVMFLLFGSMVIPHAQDFFSECLWTLFSVLSLSLFCSFWGRSLQETGARRAVIYTVITALLVPLNPILAVVLAGLAILIATRRMVSVLSRGTSGIIEKIFRADLCLLLLSLACGIGLCLMENFLRRGDALNFGYGGEGFTTPFLHGLAGQLFAPARGIVFYIPAFFLGFVLLWHGKRSIPESIRSFVTLSLIYSVLLIAAYAKWHAWHGAWYWGPRFLLPLSVFGCLYFALTAHSCWRKSIWMRAGLFTIALLSVMVHKVGVSIGLDRLRDCLILHRHTEFCYWQWEFLPYASWFNQADLASMFADRSTPVEAAALLLMLLLLRPPMAASITPG